jgi:sarcosine oxidase subunit gamma
MEPIGPQARIAGRDIEVRCLGPRDRFSLRGRPADVRILEKEWDLPLPAAVGSASHKNGKAAFCLGPDEWLIVVPPATGPKLLGVLSARTREMISLVDVSHRSVGLMVQGSGGPALLAAGCPLDLRLNAFPVGSACRTIFAGVEVTLWRPSASSLSIEFWRSYAGYIWQFLNAAAADL